MKAALVLVAVLALTGCCGARQAEQPRWHAELVAWSVVDPAQADMTTPVPRPPDGLPPCHRPNIRNGQEVISLVALGQLAAQHW
jgi:hypothetical protein